MKVGDLGRVHRDYGDDRYEGKFGIVSVISRRPGFVTEILVRVGSLPLISLDSTGVEVISESR